MTFLPPVKSIEMDHDYLHSIVGSHFSTSRFKYNGGGSFVFISIQFHSYIISPPGYIGKLKLQIPVRYIKSQPWVVQIDQLYIVAGPAQPGAYNEEEELAREQTAKQVKLAKLEEGWRAEQQRGRGWWFWSPFSASLPSNVIANLQVSGASLTSDCVI